MSLSTADVTAIKAYVQGVYSEDQLKKWTNPDVAFVSITGIDDTMFTAMINSAYAAYLTFFSQQFSSSNARCMEVISRTTIFVMRNWRSDKLDDMIEKYLVNQKKAFLMQQKFMPAQVDLSENPKNIDSSTVTYQGPDYDDKM